jgi:HemY protein
MVRLVLFLIAVALLASGLAWLADRPGSVVLTWQGYEIETSVFRAVVILALLLGAAITLWGLLRQLWMSPGRIGLMIDKRRHQRGLEALSSGMIAIGAGDRSSATRYAVQARKALPDEPMTHLLRAQAAQLSGDRTTARRIFEAMLAERDTEQLGLRGLFLEAEKEGEKEAARQFAERALRLNPKLAWPFDALFDLQCRAADWEGALTTLSIGKKHGHIERGAADRKRAVLLAALAQETEETDPVRAQSLALEAHKLALDLVPAAEIAARQLASRGQTGKAAKVLEATWKRSAHPALANAYAYARPGDSPRDRLERVRTLVRQSSHSIEGPIALALAALEAHVPDEAARALEPLLAEQASQRVCTLMAKIEAERGNKGRVREWLARAVNAPRDPAWTADGVVSETWRPISPVTGALDAFRWKVPGEQLEARDRALLASEAEQLIALGAAAEGAGALEAPATSTVVVSADGEVARRSAAAAIQVAAAARAAGVLAEARPTPLAEAAVVLPAVVVPAAATTQGTALAATKGEVATLAEAASAPVPSTTTPPAGMAAPAGPPVAAAAPLAVAAPAPASAEQAAANATTTGKETAGSPVAVIAAKGAEPAGTRKPAEPRFYSAPRAPDDPGPDAREEADAGRGREIART